jgi:DNA-binding LacI/PurR family transcriptional regulator
VTNGRSMDKKYNYVDYDNYSGAFAAVEHLIGLGHKKIGVITGSPTRLVSINRQVAYEDAMKAHGLPVESRLIVPGYFKVKGGYEACKQLLHENPKMTAIFAFNDLSAIGAIRAIREASMKVPEDISVVGFDDMEIATYSDPPLTTVTRFSHDISHLMAQAIDDLARNPNIEHLAISLKTSLVVRQSTKALI